MSFFSDVERECRVTARDEVADGVVAITIAAVNGRDLPAWTPGSHVDLLLTDRTGARLERQYSLCGDPGDRTRYRVAVLREHAGRGGSALIHDDLQPGDAMRIRGPRNHFGYQADAAAPVVFIAGGIGITPFLSMAAAALADAADYWLLYVGRTRRTMAFLAELEAAHGARVRAFPADQEERIDLRAEIAALPADASVYCCGPIRLLAAVEEAWHGRPVERLHVEHFEAKEYGDPIWQDSFEVELALTGVTVEVPLERTILEVVEEQGVLVVSSCRKGTCGTCETPVVEGEIEHRDSVLTPGERDAADAMMICVSRAAGPLLVLDL